MGFLANFTKFYQNSPKISPNFTEKWDFGHTNTFTIEQLCLGGSQWNEGGIL
jgi:hypothetical protein